MSNRGQLTYAEAEAKMAGLLKDAIDYLTKCREDHGYEAGVFMSGQELTEEEEGHYGRLRHKAEKYADELAADPAFFDILESYMTDVKGTGGMPSEDSVKEVVDSGFERDEIFGFLEKMGGNLVGAVRNFIEDLGFRICDAGGGGGSWHLGVRGNEPDSRRLCAALHKQFGPALDAGMIKIERHHWGYRLPTLYNDGDVERYFEDHG